MITEYPTELDGLSADKKRAVSNVDTSAKKEDENQEFPKEADDGLIAANGQYYVDKDKVDRQSQYLVSTMASQNKVRNVSRSSFPRQSGQGF